MKRILILPTLLLMIVLLVGRGAVPSVQTQSTAVAADSMHPASSLHYFVSSSASGFAKSNVCQVSGGLLLHCYTPGMMQRAYNFVGAYALTGGEHLAGNGVTIVIIDAFGSPTIMHDLGVFDSTFNLPRANLNIVCPQGCPVFNSSDSNQIGWSFETTLDVEYSHAMAPGATIELVVAKTNSNPDVLAAEQVAFQIGLGQIWSQSFGNRNCHLDSSSFAGYESLYQQAKAAGVTVLASSGDSDAQNGCANHTQASYPAASVFNLAIGGTHLNILPNGMYLSETTWNDQEDPFLLIQGVSIPIGTGGAPSNVYPVPAFQSGLTITPYNCLGSLQSTCAQGLPTATTTRTTSDVSYDADIDGGVLAYWSVIPNQAGFYIFGGTSAGSPQWAAVVAIADQLHGSPLGWLNAKLYKLSGTSALNDVTQGSNSMEPGMGYLASTGYDAPTGVGTPNVGILVQAL